MCAKNASLCADFWDKRRAATLVELNTHRNWVSHDQTKSTFIWRERPSEQGKCVEIPRTVLGIVAGVDATAPAPAPDCSHLRKSTTVRSDILQRKSQYWPGREDHIPGGQRRCGARPRCPCACDSPHLAQPPPSISLQPRRCELPPAHAASPTATSVLYPYRHS